MTKSDLGVKAGQVVVVLTATSLFAACGSRGELLGTVGTSDGATPQGDGGALSPPPRFAPPTLVAALADPSAKDEDPTFTGDLVELYFMSSRAGTRDIWQSRRLGVGADAVWGPPSIVVELNSPASDWAPAVSLDGLAIWLATDRGGAGGQIWQATRPSRAAAWGSPRPVDELASDVVDFAPAVDATDTILFFASTRAGANFDIFSASRATAGTPWGAPIVVPGVNSTEDEYDPFVAQGGLVVFFTSMRAGGGDLYWSVRRSITEPFAPPVPLVDLNSSSYDSDTTLSPDLTYLMFSSTRSGNGDIFESRALR